MEILFVFIIVMSLYFPCKKLFTRNISDNPQEFVSDIRRAGLTLDEWLKDVNENPDISPYETPYPDLTIEEYIVRINEKNNINNSSSPIEVVIKDGGIDTSKLLNYEGEKQAKFKFRPNTFEEFIGQKSNKEIIKDALKGIKMGELFHFFFYAKPGVGKTSMARVIQKKLDAEMIEMIGKQITNETLINAMNIFYKSDKEYCILFVDEVDTVKPELCKIMNPMIEDFKLGDKQLRPFIFIGCTINKNILIKRGNGDFLGRVNYPIMFDKYNKNDIIKILNQYIEQVYPQENFDKHAIEIVAENCRNEPRKAIHMLKHYRINKNIDKMIRNYKIIKNGLTVVDVRVLRTLNSKYPKTMSASALSQSSGVNTDDYITDIEPFLVEEGYIERPHKRIISKNGIKLLEGLK